MSYTEIPTDLLVEMNEIIQWIGCEEGRDDAYSLVVEIKDGATNKVVDPETYDFVVRFTRRDIEQMQPLVKWLEYAAAKWHAKDFLEKERKKLLLSQSVKDI
ncbi:hypothetical protein [Mycobacterium intracellulare]|uniref:hypothetical protein n=1 Tax=Mycobacterium intracellulare TaxID=1767 RepID=UPI0019154768|nr:hypothetical protein [Mycobacterium intracellulare]BCO67527.1 hypothetical protein MINTM007_21380 [Mycobacterium intracellulare]BCO73057.1 hypothetical protein MINTM008_23920 [Mycobacterium intracellulare]BCO78498.1 hypothetical protein MINTM009_22800 [Mycobacterium intracellulare]BCP31475.1 hypothetical protein MINTM026_24450 [Mycobacterium intracellulare]BCP42420.1 hypothetical protein MINTMi27_25130 [Mycobacterium intracellulare]